MLNYWIKILKNKESLMYKIYVMLRNDMNNGRNYNGCNWAFNIRSVLDELGCTYMVVSRYNNYIPTCIKRKDFLSI